MAMLRHRAARDSDVEAHLLVSTRSEEDALWRDELAGLQPRDGLHVTWTFTRMPPEGWTGLARRVDREMLAEVGPPPAARPRCFACGPTGFVEVVAGLLVDLGHAGHRIHAERFGPTGG
jgi:ferredoxin-NADP reductase